jgi:hypothetical protein
LSSHIRIRTYIGDVRKIFGPKTERITGRQITCNIVVFNKEYFYQIEAGMARHVVRRRENEYLHGISARKLKRKRTTWKT